VDGASDERPAAQRRADGFADILDAYLGCGASPTEGGVKPHVTVTFSARDLAEHADDGPVDLDGHGVDLGARWPFQLAWMGPISGAAARMLACDCDLSKVLLNDDGVPLNLGRSERLITPGLRRALVIRDHGCAFTGCGRPAAWCQGHHVVFWANGGLTDLANLVLLCKAHHRFIHRDSGRCSSARTGTPGSCHPRPSTPSEDHSPPGDGWGHTQHDRTDGTRLAVGRRCATYRCIIYRCAT